jgi:hypothetical protein
MKRSRLAAVTRLYRDQNPAAQTVQIKSVARLRSFPLLRPGFPWVDAALSPTYLSETYAPGIGPALRFERETYVHN